MKVLQTIAARAAEQQLPFLLGGGHAVIAHGHPRATFDLDLITRTEDREAWKSLTRALGYSLLHEAPAFLQLTPSCADTPPLDLMFVNGETFAKLLAEAAPGPAGTTVKVVSLRHLLALKCHAIRHGHAGRIVKDVDDVIRLIQANGLDINAPELRELVLKHGTAELYEKIRQICGPDRSR